MGKMDSIEWLKNIGKNNTDRIFLIDEQTNSEITFEKVEEMGSKIANFLLELGFSKGDRISVILDEPLILSYIYFGMLYSGISVVPINPILTKEEIKHILISSKSKGIITSKSFEDKFDFNNFEDKKIIFYNNSDKHNLENIIELNFEKLKKSNFIPFTNVTSEDEIVVIYTSGTTSQPKAVTHRISNLVENAKVFGRKLKIGKEQRFCNILSLTYLGGYYNLLMLPYVLESSVVLSHTFDPRSAINFWEPIEKYNVNILWLVPSIMSILMEIDRSDIGKKYCRKNIQKILVGTAPLSSDLHKKFEQKYGVKIFENYGLSETFFISTNSDSKNKIGTVGEILEEISVKIVDKHGNSVNDGIEGEILVKTPFLMKGHYDSLENKNNQIPLDEWFETGDVGIFENSMLQITGRKKDLIIRGGINISPASIENIIYKNSEILECAVIGIAHKIQGEEIIAVIRIKNENTFEEIQKQLVEFCKKELSKIKQPSKIIHLLEFPHSTYGKIQKNKIRSWLLNQNAVHDTKIISISNLQKENYEIIPSKIVSESIEALSIKYNTLVYEKQRKGEDIIVLSLGEAFFKIPLFSFDELPIDKIYHYSNSRGIPELRQKLAEYFLDTYDVSFDYEKEILLTAGSKIAIYMSLMTLINPRDEVIIHEPAWVSYSEQIKLCQGVPIQIPYSTSVFEFEQFISKKTKMIIINNPNNPSGKVYSLEELTYLHELAKKYQIYILSDEAYSDFILNQDEFISFAHLDIKKKHSIVVNSISKNFGISGWRLGYLISNSNLINQILKLNQHLITCAPTILQHYVAQHFEKIINITKPQIKDLVKKRREIGEYMKSISLENLPGDTTFYFFTSIKNSKLTSEEFCSKLLSEFHISTVPGIGYGKSCDKFIRISVGSESTDRIKKGLEGIKKLLAKT
jgi:aminotransferase